MMLRNQIKLIDVTATVTFLYFMLSSVEASRTSPAIAKAKALISTNQLGVSSDPNRHAPLWADEDEIPIKATPSKGSDTGVEPIDEVSKDVPKEWEHLHHVGRALEHLDNPEDAPEEVFTLPKITSAMIMQSLVSIFMSLICLLMCAFGYTRVKTDLRIPPNDGQDHSPDLLNRGAWRFGLFDCIHDSKICMISCCCPIIRWSDTMRMAGLMTFWSAILIMGFLYAINPLTGGLTLLVMLCIATYRRQQMRKLFGMISGDHTSVCEDCCVYFWCSCCAIAQEARQLEEAYAVGYPLQIKEPLRVPQQSQPSYMVPQQSQRLMEYQQPSPMPQPSWGQPQPQPVMQQPIMQQQPMMMPSLPPAQPVMSQPMMVSQGSMGSLPPTQSMPMQSMQSLPPQNVQSLPPVQYVQSLPPVQYQEQQFVSGPPVMGSPMGQPMPRGTPPGSLQSMPPTTYQQ